MICEVAAADAALVDEAVAAAKAAQRAWIALPAAERGRVLNRVAAILRERKQELARLEVLDTGKPIQEAPEADIGSAADCFEFFAGLTQIVHGEHMPFGDNAFAYTRREPLGVCAGIGAWNYPIQIASWKTAPALAAGNAMIFKPSELTPVTAVELAKIVEEAGAPPGLFNVVLGKGEVGAALADPSRHRKDLADRLGADGKARHGRRGRHAEARHHGARRQVGADRLRRRRSRRRRLRRASSAISITQGEICSNGTRVFVEEPVRDGVPREARRAHARNPGRRSARSGDADGPADLRRASGEGARLCRARRGGGRKAPLTGGRRLTEGALARGNFMSPAIFDACRDDMTIVREEVFGPLLSVLSFDDEAEVVARANDTPFGLAAGVMTRDLSRAHRVAAALEAGIVWINSYNLTPVAMPFGGSKQSGLGRENGLAALDFYSERKSVYVNLGRVEAPY